ncbi:MAG: SpoIIE family protein phosphatase [Deltaproteobacteria bacterium]|nr:SpoIIE family protein phosphatase [Deltaproteobacteria bacterium]
MPTSERTRAGIPLSVKLIAATLVVVVVGVTASTYFARRAITELATAHVKDRSDEGRRAIAREADLLAEKVAATEAYALGNNSSAEVQPLLDAVMKDDRASGDDRLEWLMVSDASGQVVAKTAGAPVDRIAELDKLVPGTQAGVVHAQLAPSEFLYRAPIMTGASQVGTLRMAVSTRRLDDRLTAALANADDQAAAARAKLWLVAGVLLTIGIVLALLFGLSIARPLRALTAQAGRIASGDLRQRVAEDRRDEIGVLARNFNAMAQSLSELLVHREEKASLEREMSLARSVQQSMLPPPDLVEHGVLKVIGHCAPAAACGGDWWTFRKLSGGKMLLVVGDATGHGVHSAMIAGTARGAVEALAEVDERLLTPGQVLKAIDSAIRNVGDHHVMMTAFAASFDSATGELVYANAGQNFPYVMRMGPDRTLEDATIIAASGNPLGDRHSAMDVRHGQTRMHPGDLFVCFTDGLVERQNKTGKLFGDRRLRGALHGSIVDTDGDALARLRDKVLAVSERFAEGVQAEDDITFVLCQFDPPATGQVARVEAAS